MKSLLETLAYQGVISQLSLYFAQFIAQQSKQRMDSLLVLSAALVSEANQHGDVCVRLAEYQSQPFFSQTDKGEDVFLMAPGLAAWQDALLCTPCVGLPGQVAPLILEDGCLYLYRYWYYESELAHNIKVRLANNVLIDQVALSRSLETLYSEESFKQQAAAVALSVKHRFAVISGGPGTGKTTTVIHILATLLSQQADLRIALAAPTGKAATRMTVSIQQGIDRCHLTQAQSRKIPTQAATIHRLLGYGRHGFRYSHYRQLAFDCVIVDEASMIDLTLMYRLLDALSPDTRIILLGDRDQLAAVAAGNVFADITGKDLPVDLMTKPPLAGAIALLTHSYRFDALGGIGQLAQWVNKGNSGAVMNCLRQRGSTLRWYRQSTEHFEPVVLEDILHRYQAVVNAENIDAAFDAFESSRILCAVHNGAFGVDAINELVEALMQAQGWIETQADFQGKPLLIDTNDYELELFNGDIGLLWRDSGRELSAYFRDSQRGLRRFSIASLPTCRAAWAMTIHKSQGSEFDSVLLVLPDQSQHRVLSRELLYTGITRARQTLSIYASATVLETACVSPSQRHSGLAGKLGWFDGVDEAPI